MQNIDPIIVKNRSYLEELIASQGHRFDSQLRSFLPSEPGIYYISNIYGEILRAGSIKTSDSLKQRIYQNHFMGNQTGNIRSQLVKEGTCKDLIDAKTYLKEKCVVKWKVILDINDRKWAEHFMLSILQPKFSD